MYKKSDPNTSNYLSKSQLVKELVSKEMELLHLAASLAELSSNLSQLSVSVDKMLVSHKSRGDQRGEEYV